MNKYEEMLQSADKKYSYSELEKEKIISLLDYCHASDVRRTHRRMYEVFFRCDAIPYAELTLDICEGECRRCGCSNYTAAEDAELLINQEKSIFDFEPSDDFFFEAEVKAILDKYHGNKTEKLSNTEIEQIVEEVKKELVCYNHMLES